MEKKNWLPGARKSVFPGKNKLSLAGILFKNWIPSNFNNGFHQQKKVLKSVSISLGKVTWVRFPLAGRRFYFTIGFFLISITVSTSRKKAIKSFSVQVKYYSSLQSFLLVKTIIEKCGSQFLKKTFISPSRNCFSDQSETVF